jgi:hypothetical protein
LKKMCVRLVFLLVAFATMTASPTWAQEMDGDTQCYYTGEYNETREVSSALSVSFYSVDLHNLNDVLNEVPDTPLHPGMYMGDLQPGDNLVLVATVGEVVPSAIVYAQGHIGSVLGSTIALERYYPLADECAEVEWEIEPLLLPLESYLVVDALADDHVWSLSDTEMVAVTGGLLWENGATCQTYRLHRNNTWLETEPLLGTATHVLCGDVTHWSGGMIISFILEAADGTESINGRPVEYFGARELEATPEVTTEPWATP